MRADSGPLAIFGEGSRRLVRAPLVFAALWLPSAIVCHFTGNPVSPNHIDILADTGIDVRAAIGVAFGLVVSPLLWGGILTRYARPKTTGVAAFLAGSRAFAGRMLRLALLSLIVTKVIDGLTVPDQPPQDDMVPTFDAAHWRWLALIALGLFLQLWIQLAQVRTVVEDRRSVLFALAAAMRLLVARPFTVFVMYALGAMTVVATIILVLMFGGNGAWRVLGVPVWLDGQILVLGMTWFELQISASLVALYQVEMVRLRPEGDPAEESSGLSRLNALTAKE